jgi:ABC-type Mn2+/Zn2+ transport system ATPase subunit
MHALPGTRVELLHDIEEWTTTPQGRCIFWLNGIAGTGKSTISRTVAGRLKGSLGATFFFKRGEEGRGGVKSLFPTLVEQLVANIPQLNPGVQRTIEGGPDILEKTLRQ